MTIVARCPCSCLSDRGDYGSATRHALPDSCPGHLWPLPAHATLLRTPARYRRAHVAQDWHLNGHHRRGCRRHGGGTQPGGSRGIGRRQRLRRRAGLRGTPTHQIRNHLRGALLHATYLHGPCRHRPLRRAADIPVPLRLRRYDAGRRRRTWIRCLPGKSVHTRGLRPARGLLRPLLPWGVAKDSGRPGTGLSAAARLSSGAPRSARQPDLRRKARELRAVARTQLLTDGRLVVGDGLLRKAELLTDVPDRLALREEPQNLELARTQCIESRFSRVRRRPRHVCRHVGTHVRRPPGDRIDGLQQYFRRARLADVALRSRLERTGRIDRIVVHAENQYVQLRLVLQHAACRFHAARPRKGDVHHHHVRIECARTLTRLRGIARLPDDLDVGCPLEESPVTFAHDGMVVDEQNPGRAGHHADPVSGRRGIRAESSNPSPGVLVNTSSPCNALTRSRMPINPSPRVGSPAAVPAPSSATDTSMLSPAAPLP